MLDNTTASRMFMTLLLIFSNHIWASSTGADNLSSLSGTYTAYSTTTPKIIAEKNSSGGTVCTIASSTAGTSDFKAASAKWRSANIAGTITNGGYTYDIQRTNISGIGVISRVDASFVENQVNNSFKAISSSYQTISTTDSTDATNVFLGNIYWALVTIPGELVTPGSYSIGQAETMVDVWCQADNATDDTHGGEYLSGVVVIAAPTCTLSSDISSVLTMDLGRQSWVDVRNVSVGNNFGSVSKSLNMQCQAGTWPKLLISDKNNNSNNSDIISLTNPTATTTAQGIGVQIFINNQATAEKLATTINLTAAQLAEDSNINLPIEFKYIKTSTTLSTGDANAIVDLTFTYD